MSAISLLGYSAEFYVYGSMLLFYGVVYVIAYPLAAVVFIPVFHRLDIKSAYEYLELRFSGTVRQLVSLLFCFKLGGFKAVVWTSTFQMAIIFVGFMFVIVDGVIKQGGWQSILSAAQTGNRFILDDMRFDPRVRHSFWSLVIGGTFTILSMLAADQLTIQRYLSFKDLRKAQTALLLNIPMCFVTLFFYCSSGLIMFATYRFCDPLLRKNITRYDQLLIYYVADQQKSMNGLLGLFASAIYGAGLSTLSSGYNAVSAVILEDIVKPLYHWKSHSVLVDTKAAVVTKMALSIFGMVGGPLLGVFCLGMFFSWTNAKGALVGLCVSVAFTFYVGFGAIFSGVRPVIMPVTALGCDCHTNDTLNCTAMYDNVSAIFQCDQTCGYTVINNDPGGITNLYRVSYQYYSLIGVVIAVFFGTLVSALTGFRKHNPVDRRLLVSFGYSGSKADSKDLLDYTGSDTLCIAEKVNTLYDFRKNREFIEKF
ncbi:unnamed protein product [Soboliphyme baturini]|uniref:Sodium-dependent multivitamin transporter n=1 Tax=Soboliphyme baturini TaxID=241478 RepID=A0A183J262_9BILA|nr:unnamed protein product [Soboliphyme baturini]